MSEPVEVELKLEYDSADRDRLLASPLLNSRSGEPKQLFATYYDTPDLQLSKAGFALRIRDEEGRRIQTVKAADAAAAGLFMRGEWDRPVRDKPVLDEQAGPLGQMLDPAAIERIEPIFVTEVERVSGPVEHGDALIEYAVDSGEARAGQRSAPLSELELELKKGSPQHLFDLARNLSADIPLRLGVHTKSARGYALVGKAAPPAFKAEPIRLDPEMSAAEAFATIAASCIRHYRTNEALMLQGGGPEAVHQARVAIRRLRSAFSLFRPLFAGDQRAEVLTTELRWLAGQLGEIRDIDVLLPQLEGQPREAVSAIRESRFGHFRGLLEGGRIRLLPIELAEWLAIGSWLRSPADPRPRDQNVRIFAGDRLDRLRRRIKREGRGLASTTDEHRHEVRKDAKKLRYAAEFLVSLYPGRKPRLRIEQMLDRIETLQDKLGQLNDMAAAPELLARLGLDVEMPSISAKERRKLLESAEDCFEALIDTKCFWRV